MDSVALGTALDEASMAVLVAHGARERRRQNRR